MVRVSDFAGMVQMAFAQFLFGDSQCLVAVKSVFLHPFELITVGWPGFE